MKQSESEGAALQDTSEPRPAVIHRFEALDQAAVERLGEVLAMKLARGDCVALRGDLGAGKSTLARAAIRASLEDPAAEVPSPTFTLLQAYDGRRLRLAHADLYRLTDPAEIEELGLDDALAAGALLIEWPERAEGWLPDTAIEIAITAGTEPGLRAVTLTGSGEAARRIDRVAAILRFTQGAGAPAGAMTAGYRLRFLQGDASPRAYIRFVPGEATATRPRLVLMDAPRQPDGPPVRGGKPYSRIAHLAEDVGSFVAVQRFLAQAGLSVPSIHAMDLDRGLLLMEDLGDGVYGSLVAAGEDQFALWRDGVTPLVEIAGIDVPDAIDIAPDRSVSLPTYDSAALGIETELLTDWAFPLLLGRAATAAERETFDGLWAEAFAWLAQQPRSLVLRDYHSPNLLRLAGREGVRRVGIIDFQDAVRGHAAYDLVSLLQDARLDVPAAMEGTLYAAYIAARQAREPGFDAESFARAYVLLGLQRNTKILGIFCRLAVRDRKLGYLVHLPRIIGYIDRALASPHAAPMREWYQRHVLSAAIDWHPDALARCAAALLPGALPAAAMLPTPVSDPTTPAHRGRP